MRRMFFGLLASVLIAFGVTAWAQQGPIIIPRAPDVIGRVPGAQPPSPITPEMARSCYVSELAAYPGRVHIKCWEGSCAPGSLCPQLTPESTAIHYYATENTGAPTTLAATAMTLAAYAKGAGKRLRIIYRSNAAENPAGCLAKDCRRFVGVVTE